MGQGIGAMGFGLGEVLGGQVWLGTGYWGDGVWLGRGFRGTGLAWDRVLRQWGLAWDTALWMVLGLDGSSV